MRTNMTNTAGEVRKKKKIREKNTYEEIEKKTPTMNGDFLGQNRSFDEKQRKREEI